MPRAPLDRWSGGRLPAEQDVAIARGVGAGGEIFRHRAIQHLDAIDARADRVELLAPQVGRQRPLAVGAVASAERLPGEVVVVEAEAAGQAFDARAAPRRLSAT